MRFASLGSGSEGNGLIVEAAAGAAVTRILLDCGFGLKETLRRLARLGLEADSLDGILVTHEHSDHIGGVAAFASKFGTPVWLTFGTLSAVSERFAKLPKLPHQAAMIGFCDSICTSRLVCSKQPHRC